MPTYIPITVGLPVYNAAPYLKECIDSILSQSFMNFELLIIDDGSTDTSIDIIREYKDERIRLIESEHNYIRTINRLIEESKGKYFARMDADDIMMPDRLQIQYDYMEAHPDIDILGGAVQYFGDTTGTFTPYHKGVMEMGMFANGCALAHSSVMLVRKRFLDKKLRYDERYVYAEDYHLWVQALEAGLHITNVKPIIMKYRFSKSQVSTSHYTEQTDAARRVKQEIIRWQNRNELKWTLAAPYKIPKTKNLLTIIIPFLNEKEEVEITVKEIRKTVGNTVDIIVINDASIDGFPYGESLSLYEVHYILNLERKGVAACRDLGVQLCQTPYFLLLDAHMRFYDNLWAEKIICELKSNDRQLLCCQTRFLHRDKNTGKVLISTECPQTYGAYSPFDKKVIWPDISWNLKEQKPGENKEEIPCVLGAGYSASKRYWTYLKGLEGLRYYGSDESYISFKVWLEGGKCVLLKDVIIGHIYRTVAPYQTINKDYIYNQIFIARQLFPISVYCHTLTNAFIHDKTTTRNIIYELNQNKTYIKRLRTYYTSIFTKSFRNLIQTQSSYHHVNDTTYCNIINKLPEIYQYIIENTPSSFGLLEGKAGILLWLSHYFKQYPHPNADYTLDTLWEDIDEAISKNLLPWGFSHGISGIGWMILYLSSNNLISYIPEELLTKIDDQLTVIDPTLCKNHDFFSGIGGVLAYLSLRKQCPDFKWDASILNKWKKTAIYIINNSHDFASIYYSLLYLMSPKDNKDEDVYHSISNWMKISLFLPKNKKYWVVSFNQGVLSTSLSAMLIHKNNSYEIK